MVGWRLRGAVVATKPRDVPIPLPARACYETEGIEEVVSHTFAGEEDVSRAEEHETIERAAV